MGEFECFLVCVAHSQAFQGEVQNTVARCALKVKRNTLPEGLKTPVTSEHHEFFFNLLPEHVQSMGPIIRVDSLFEITIVE